MEKKGLKTINMAELNKVLKQHEKWLNTKGSEGEKADLNYSDLKGINFRGADLRHINFIYSDLSGADLSHADLRNANFRDAVLVEANLEGADLLFVNLRNADLRQANLDFSCLPFWKGSETAQIDDNQLIQIIYHAISLTKYSDNVSQELKDLLLTENNLEVAGRFHKTKYDK